VALTNPLSPRHDAWCELGMSRGHRSATTMTLSRSVADVVVQHVTWLTRTSVFSSPMRCGRRATSSPMARAVGGAGSTASPTLAERRF
jgi:hypothetical protein